MKPLAKEAIAAVKDGRIDFIPKRWEKDYPHESKAVWDAAKEVIKEVRNAAFVSSDGLLSNEEEIHNGDLLHFSRRSQEILGERYFASLELLLTNQK